MSKKNAPDWRVEGADQNTYEGEPIMNTVLPDTPEVHDAWRRFGFEFHEALARAFYVDKDAPEFVAFIAEGAFTTAHAARAAYAWHVATPPEVPAIARPAWAAESTVGFLGGEVIIQFEGAPHGRNGIEAQISASVHVLVLPEVQREEPGMAEIGDHTLEEATIGWVGPESWDGSDWQQVDALSKALRGAALQLRDIEAGARWAA